MRITTANSKAAESGTRPGVKRVGFALAAGALCGSVNGAEKPARLFDAWTYQPVHQTAAQQGGPYGHFIPSAYVESVDYFAAAIASNSKVGHLNAINTRCWDVGRIAPVIDWMQHNKFGLDYVFADAECDGVDGNIRKMQSYIDKVRSSSDPNIAGAKVGNWSWFDGMYTDTWWFYQPWPVWPDHVRAETFARTTLQISQPALYAYSYNIKHVTSGDWLNGTFHRYIGGASPNERSAQFWAPLEILSSAKRRLPIDQELIPAVSDYLHVKGFDPKRDQRLMDADYSASILHYRLRGADGLYVWGEKNDARYLRYRTLVAKAWKGLQPFFERIEPLQFLNAANRFGTHKDMGIEWSAAIKGNRVVGVVSNLTNVATTVNWATVAAPTGMPAQRASILSLPPSSPVVAANTHLVLKYRSPHFVYDAFESKALGDTVHSSASSAAGSTAGWTVAKPLGRGNASHRAIGRSNGAGRLPEFAWFKIEGSEYFRRWDKVTYSAAFYFDGSPLTIALTSELREGVPTADNFSGRSPQLRICDLPQGTRFCFNAVVPSDPGLVSVKPTPVAGRWYEFKLDVDPASSTQGAGKMWIRDLTSGERDFSLLAWQDATGGDSSRRVHIPLSLSAASDEASFTHWRISAGRGAQFDNFSVGHTVATADDNFDHYAEGAALSAQGWRGPAASQWRVSASQSKAGNPSRWVATPRAGAHQVWAWRRTNAAEFDRDEAAVYSAMLYGSKVGFAPVATTAATANSRILVSGPHFSMSTLSDAGFYLRTTADDREYKATIEPVSGHWYEVQVIVNPAVGAEVADVDASGLAKVYVRDRTLGTDFVRLAFTPVANRANPPMQVVPLGLIAMNNPTNWDGWQIYGEDAHAQVDNLKAFLYPYADFDRGSAIHATMIGPNP